MLRRGGSSCSLSKYLLRFSCARLLLLWRDCATEALSTISLGDVSVHGVSVQGEKGSGVARQPDQLGSGTTGSPIRSRIKRSLQKIMHKPEQRTLLATESKNDTRQLAFVHIPKTGGSTIESVGEEYGLAWGENDPGLAAQQVMADGHTCNRWHVPPRFLGPPSPYDGKELFCITRHPYDRAVSEYLYLLSVPWGVHDSREAGAPVDDYQRCSAEGLNAFIQNAMILIQHGQPFVFDCHFVPQHLYLWNEEGNETCNDIIPLTSLDPSFDELMARKELPARLSEDMTNSQTACDNISSQDLTRETKTLLDVVYKEDFALLGYSPSFFAEAGRLTGRGLTEKSSAQHGFYWPRWLLLTALNVVGPMYYRLFTMT